MKFVLKLFSFVFPGLARDPGFRPEALTADFSAKFGMLTLLVLILPGCSVGYQTQTLEEYFLINNSTQEQKNSSFNNSVNQPPSSSPQPGENASEWVNRNYPDNCEWFELDRVVDGDTIIVIPPPAPPSRGSEIRVRMIGIDTPESKREGTPIQPYALEATAALKNLLQGQSELCLIADEVGDQYDTYGRKLSYVFTRGGVDVNASMLIDGWAKAYTRFPMERAEAFEAYEQQAREAKVGRWE